MIIIGIAGGTGSGKTTVVRRIIESLSTDEAVVVPLDSYYKDSSHVPVEERQNINFDHPNAFDWDLLSEHISKLRRGEAVEQPVYSYLTCTRHNGLGVYSRRLEHFPKALHRYAHRDKK